MRVGPILRALYEVGKRNLVCDNDATAAALPGSEFSRQVLCTVGLLLNRIYNTIYVVRLRSITSHNDENGNVYEIVLVFYQICQNDLKT